MKENNLDLTRYVLPYPYEAYTEFKRRDKSFEDYKNKIFGWVEENTMQCDVAQYINSIFSIFSENSEYYNSIKMWLLNHLDKIRYIGDFSGLAFGVQVDEENESVSVRRPGYMTEEDKVLYPDYDEDLLNDMDIINKLEWLYKHCEFIPFCILHEDIWLPDASHKFSHIKRNKFVMNHLNNYLANSKFQPSDNVYYFLRFNSKTGGYYLKRDLDKSPKRTKVN